MTNTQPDSKNGYLLIKRLVKTYLLPMKGRVIFATICMLISAITTGAFAKLMEPIIDDVLTAGDEKMLWPVAFFVMAIFVTRGLTSYGHTVIMNKVGQRMVSNIQTDMFNHLIRSDLAFFHDQKSGTLQSRFIMDLNLIRNALIASIIGIGKNFFTLIVLIIVMFLQDWKLSLASLFVFPIMGFFVVNIGKRLRKVSKSTQEEVGNLNSVLGQAFRGSKHIKAYGAEDYEEQRTKKVIEKLYNLMCRNYTISAISSPMSEMLAGLAVVTIVVYGGYQVIDGESSAGKLFSFIMAFILAFEPTKKLTTLNNKLQTGIAAAERLFDILDTKPEVIDHGKVKEFSGRKPTISFEDVTFSYELETGNVLNGISFEAPAGKVIALVGESGAGKTTILNLIPRFYDIQDGHILLNGEDIKAFSLKSVRKSMAIVSQDVAIFEGTIRENIAYGNDNIADADLYQAAENAAAHEFISELPDGYNTVVGENGVKLSGGQRQRISIARAILRNAPILLLDEATSSLDNKSERFVQAALNKLQSGRTTIVVAHRLSTIVNADIIYFLDGGKVVEHGSHDALVKQNGKYAKLYKMMLKEEEE